MTRQDVLNGIVKILQDVKTVDQEALKKVSEDSDFIADLGLPSTELINIIAKAEDEFGLEFEDDDVDALGSKVADTIDLVMRTQQPAK
ncbi:MAG: acyl carrier protein [Bacteroidetes bacterium]|nr:acyl carrier protein [Bacteroidota bacterium]